MSSSFVSLGVNAADAACPDNERSKVMFRELADRRKKSFEMRQRRGNATVKFRRVVIARR
jgi:hypothetical protein